MKCQSQNVLQSTAATAAAGMFSSSAWAAEDPISVASIHDLSGGLDIYGKPMVDALTLAVEEANAAGGLLGRQIKLINYDTQSNMQLYTQFAQQAALKDKVAVVHGGITSASREVIRPVLDKFKTLYFYNTQYEGGVCDRNQFDTGVTPAQTVEKLVPYAMKKWGKKVYVVAADYNYGQITSQWVKKYVTENGGEVPSIDFFPLDVTNFGLDHLQDPGGEAGFRLVGAGRRRAYLVLSPVGGGRHEQEHSDGVDHIRRRQRAHRAVAGRMQRHAGLLQLLRGRQEPGQQGVRCELPQALRRRLSQRHRARDGHLSGLPAVGGGGEEGRQHRPDEGDRGAGDRHQHRCALGQGDDRSADASLRARRAHCRGARTRSSRCWKISRSRSRPTPPRSAISSRTRTTTSNM